MNYMHFIWEKVTYWKYAEANGGGVDNPYPLPLWIFH